MPAGRVVGPRRIEAGEDGVAAGGDVSGNAFGPNSQAVREQHNHYYPAAAGKVAWPVEVGAVPPPASAFQRRDALRSRLDATVLTQVLSGGSGVGKSQLAAACATEAAEDGTDLVLWAPAGEVQQVVTLYAEAAARVQAPGASGQDPVADARAFLAWLRTTDRRWLVVLDDVTDPGGVQPWWPASRTGTGRVIATSRLNDPRLTGNGRTRVHVDVYSPEEALAYLRARLAREDAVHLLDARSAELASALGRLPLALSHAAVYMIAQDLTSSAYLARYTAQDKRLDELLPDDAESDGYGRRIAATLLLNLDAARRAPGGGLVEPVLRLTALLDPAGQPHRLWSAPSALGFLAEHRDGAVTAEEAHAALRALHRHALLTCDTHSEPATVRIHALTARAVRETTPDTALPRLATAAADALLETWPDPDQPHRALAALLRGNADVLARHARDHLWHSGRHAVLFRAGGSLQRAGLPMTAAVHWRTLLATAERLLGRDHPHTLTTRAGLASSYRQAGRTAQAVALEEEVLADRERILGRDHPATLTTRNNLASSYQHAGRIEEAAALQEDVLADTERVLGRGHPHTLAARHNLASCYWHAGRTDEALALQGQVLADRERLQGADHPATLAARHNLASCYWQAGRTDEALVLEERVLADRERVLGPHHPHTLATRHNLALSHWHAGRTAQAVTLLERVVADSARVLGPEHPDHVLSRQALERGLAHLASRSAGHDVTPRAGQRS